MTAGFLTNGHTYEFKVTATLFGRDSAPSNVVQGKPQVPLPGPVTGLTATAKTDGTIELTWTAPGDNLWFDVYQRDATAGESFTKLSLPVTACCTMTAGYLTHNHAYEFRVAATNGAGAGPLSAVAGATARYSPPGAPQNLRGEPNGDGTIHLDWDAPGSGSFLYWVYSRDVTAGQTAFTKGQLPTERTEADMGFLQNNHVYEYKVTASNQGGEGPASTPVQVTSKGGLPAAPRGLTATAGDGQATLGWTASSTSGVNYIVYQRDVTAGQSWQKLPLPVTGTSMTAGYLTNGHTYEWRVAANNFAGNSGFSNVASARPLPPRPTAPSGLSASAGDGRVNLSWTASTPSNVYYWVEMRPAGGTWDRLPLPVSTCCSLAVTFLRNGTTYEFRVLANNLAGDSGFSNVASSRPMPPFPQPASHLTASAGDGRVTLKWSASPTSGVLYYIEVRSKGGGWQRPKYPVGCCSFTVSLLNNGTTYEFRIRAANLSGVAEPTNTASARPMPPIPGRPTDLQVHATISGGIASLRWTPSPTPYVGYRVYMRNVSANGPWVEALVFPDGPGATIQYLTLGRQYEFRVTAVNMSGESDPSNTVLIRVPYTQAVMECSWLNPTRILIIVNLHGYGVADGSRISLTVERTFYIAGREYQEFTDHVQTTGQGYWEAPKREIQVINTLGLVNYEMLLDVYGPSGDRVGLSRTGCG